MFILDLPDLAINAKTVIVADTKKIVKSEKHVLGLCHVVPNYKPNGWEGSGEYSFSPEASARAYFKLFESRNLTFDAKVKVLTSPKHGKLVDEGPSVKNGIVTGGNNSFAYHPDNGYIGKDSATLLVEIGEYSVQVKYFFQTVNHELGNYGVDEACGKRGKYWKISLANPESQTDFTNWQTTANLNAMLANASQVGIKNNEVEPHEHHFHLYLKPPAPKEITKGPQSMTADFASWDDAVEDANNEQKELVQAGSSSLVKKKLDKIVSECTMARTYANDSTHPVMVAKGQYAHNYEENQKLKVLNLEVVTKPKHGNLNLITTTKNGRGELFPPYFEMVAHSVDYIGEDFAEYRVDLSNGKSVLVREYMYWVNKELDSFGGCGASKKQIREMREYQKKHPEEFKKASLSDNFLLSPTIDAWLQKVDLDDIISSAYNINMPVEDLHGSLLAQTVGTGRDASITLDTNAATG